jgi:hypothetical protein
MEVAMIEVYLQEAFLRKRLANARRDAALYQALCDLEARRTSAWRDAIHRLFHAVSSRLRLRRRREGRLFDDADYGD